MSRNDTCRTTKLIPFALALFLSLSPALSLSQLKKVVFVKGAQVSSISFAAKVDFSTGLFPGGVVVDDLNGDAKPDLIVMSINSNTVSVFRNTSITGNISNSSFNAKVDFPTGVYPATGAVGDLDGDGKPDLVLTNYYSNTISIFRNTSTIDSISFASKVDFAVGSYPFGVAIGDVDGDGKLDVVITNRNSNTVSIFRNTSSVNTITAESFAPNVDFQTGSYPLYVAFGELDGDGKLDLVVANSNSNCVSVYRNTSTEGSITETSFAGKVDFATGTYPIGLVLGDLDGDGKLDIATENYYSNTISVLRNLSSAGIIAETSFATDVEFPTGDGPHSVAIGDVNGDGKPDLSVSNSVSNTVSVYENLSSSGSITAGSLAPKVDYATGDVPEQVAFGDFDGDGRLDFAVSNSHSNTVSVFWNDSNNVVSRLENLTAIPGNGQVTLMWNKSSRSDFLHYRIYSGTSIAVSSRLDSTTDNVNDTSIVIKGLINGTTYFFRVTVVDSSGIESDSSYVVRAIPILPFQVLSIKDVPNDEGKSVSIIWRTFEMDSERPFLVSTYNVWRRDTASIWTHVWQLPARGDPLLSVVVSTLFDSTKTNGMHWSVFQVTAHGIDPLQIAYSIVDSGYSVDNLAPNVPSGVQARISGNDVVLSWERSKDPDFRYFAIYRSSARGQFPQGSQPYKTTTDTTFADIGAASTNAFYRISAIDFSGNESSLGHEISGTTSVANANDAVPKEFYLYPNFPNPFNPSTVIRFSLPERSRVTLSIFDTIGQEIEKLFDGELDASYQEIPWKANVASGIYFCRLEAVSIADPSKHFVDVKKMVLLK
jgi:hypothetical protein